MSKLHFNSETINIYGVSSWNYGGSEEYAFVDSDTELTNYVDRYSSPLPIQYAEGCTRRMEQTERTMEPDFFGMGYVVADKECMAITESILHRYAYSLALQILNLLDADCPEAYRKLLKEDHDECQNVIRRFLPLYRSNFECSHPGGLDTNMVVMPEPREQYFAIMMDSDSNVRKQFIHHYDIDTDYCKKYGFDLSQYSNNENVLKMLYRKTKESRRTPYEQRVDDVPASRGMDEYLKDY